MKIKMSSVSLDTVGMFARGATGNARLTCLNCGCVWDEEVSSISTGSKCPACGEVKVAIEYPSPETPQQEVK